MKSAQRETALQRKIQYFKVSHNFPDTEVSKIAHVRRLCMEITEHEGKTSNMLKSSCAQFEVNFI